MSEIADFIKARLDELEAAAKEATPGPWITGAGAAHLCDNVIYGQSGWLGNVQQVANVDYAQHKAGNAAHIALHDPQAVLADIASKRKILGFYELAVTWSAAAGDRDAAAKLEVLQLVAEMLAEPFPRSPGLPGGPRHLQRVGGVRSGVGQ